MRNFVFVLFAIIASTALGSEAASPRLTEKSVLETVKKNPHLRAYYSKDKKGNKVLVITNRSASGDRTRRTAPVVPAARSKSVETLTRTPVRQQPLLNRRSPKTGIPIVPNRNAQRPINPYKPVNPFKDPTAIPTTSPDSNN